MQTSAMEIYQTNFKLKKEKNKIEKKNILLSPHATRIADWKANNFYS